MNNRSVFIAFVVVVAIMVLADRQLHVTAWHYAFVVFVFLLVNTYGSIDVRSQFFMKSLFRSPVQTNAIALTFDDGPVQNTSKVLDILDEYGVKATFFCIGQNAKNNTQLLKEIHERGHLVGNHSFYHGALFDLQLPSRMKTELVDTDSVILETIGRKPRYFRPPYGVTNPMLSDAVDQTGHLTIGWSMRSLDTVIKDEQKLFARITESLQGGDILLLHEKCDVTVAILPRLLVHLRESGMSVEPLDRLLGEEAYV